MTEKELLYGHCLDIVQQRIVRLQDEISKTQADANQETKSSAGDKYETGRAMAQLEIERNSIQLREAEKLKSVLLELSTRTGSEVIRSGSLVMTSKGSFYIAISLGRITVETKECFVISADSPIGKLLLGKKAGEGVTLNGQVYNIQSVQ